MKNKGKLQRDIFRKHENIKKNKQTNFLLELNLVSPRCLKIGSVLEPFPEKLFYDRSFFDKKFKKNTKKKRLRSSFFVKRS